LLIVAGLLAAVLIGGQRWRIEAANRTVELVVDYEEVALLAGQKGITSAECLRMLKESGATSVAVKETSLEGLEKDGIILPEVSSKWGETIFDYQKGATKAPSFFLYLKSKVTGAKWESPLASTSQFPHRARLIMPTPTDTVWHTGLGFPEEVLKEISDAGLVPIARPANDALVTGQYLQLLFSDLSKAKTTKVIFEGKSVLGFPGLLEEVAGGLSEHNLNYCWVEFAEQLGGEKLAKFLHYRQIRLHSINAEEMLRIKPEEAQDRLLRAAKERGIRLLFVRLPLSQRSDVPDQPLKFLQALADSLKANGFRLGQANVIPDYSPRLILVLLVVLGICASPFLLLNHWEIWSARVLTMLLAVKIVVAVGLLLTLASLARPLLAFVAALVFPILAVAVVFPSGKMGEPKECSGLAYALKDAVFRVVGCSVISLVGGLLVAAILSKSSYFVGGQLFRGIKLVGALPLVVVFFLLVGEVGGGERLRPNEAKVRQFLSLNIQVKHLLGLLCLLLIALIFITRTGNQPEVGVFPFEMKFRAFLETALGARPRTKEFLFGHPLLLLGFVAYTYGAASQWRRWASALVLVGTIGQVSLLNTFCHLHSPLYLGLWRTFNGLWLGCILGVILSLLIFTRRQAAVSQVDEDKR
jgi:hypothetical protein